jgi:hypothetical protein
MLFLFPKVYTRNLFPNHGLSPERGFVLPRRAAWVPSFVISEFGAFLIGACMAPFSEVAALSEAGPRDR